MCEEKPQMNLTPLAVTVLENKSSDNSHPKTTQALKPRFVV